MSEWVSELNGNRAASYLYYRENQNVFYEIMMTSVLYYTETSPHIVILFHSDR